MILMNKIVPKQGYVYIAKFNPTSGGIKKTRPCLVIQSNILNQEISSVMVIPVSSNNKFNRPGYQIKINETFLQKESYLLTNMVTTLNISRFQKELGKVRKNTYTQLIENIKLIIG